MRKVYMMMALAAAFLFSANAFAGKKILYSQDFEMATDPTQIGWASPNLASGMTIPGDEYGHYFQFDLGGNNGRNCYLLWGQDIYADKLEADGTYRIEFEWNNAQAGNNQDGTQVTVFSNDKCVQNNGNYITNANAQWLFALTELDRTTNTFQINGEEGNEVVITPGTWVVISLEVNVNTRTVTYELVDLANTPVASGVRNVPEEMSMYAAGINQYNARYYSITQMDNIQVYVATDTFIANPPSVALTGVNGTERTYSISFGDEEDLYVKGTDGNEFNVRWSDCQGTYKYTTSTSGTLEAWTVSGDATSEKVSVEVECVMISLPAATATISGVDAGYAKTYTLTVSNAEVPTQPQLFLEYEYVNEQGQVEIKREDRFSGEVVNVTSKGTLTVTTVAPGFQSTTVSIVNNEEFAILDNIDFQHMTADQLLALGFFEQDPVDSDATSGENNWTARKRMNYNIETGEVDEEGKPVLENVVVYGPSTQGYEPIRKFKFYQSKLDSITSRTLFAPLYTWFYNDGITPTSCDADGNPLESDSEQPKGSGTMVHAFGGTANIRMYLGIGLLQSGVQGDEENYDPAGAGYGNIRINNAVLGVNGLTENDFIQVNKIDDYGSSAVHPTFPVGTTHEDGTAQYKAMNLGGLTEIYNGTQTFQLYRVQTAITRVTTFRANGSEGVKEVNNAAIVSDSNAPVYNINGVRVNPANLQKGVYIKQGKKFVIR